MSEVLLQVALAAALVMTSSLVARRWGLRAAGVTSALPAIPGPFLLLVADQHGARAASAAASGTLAGLLTLSGFAVVYGQTARGHGWLVSLAVAWGAAAILAVLLDLLAPGAPLGALVGASSLALAWRLMPTTEQTQPRTGGIVEVLWSTAIAALLVFVLAQAVGALGARAGGALAGLPVIATVLAVNAHRRRGAAAPTTLLRGMLEGMAGFVVFCEVVAAFAIRGGTLLTFLLAALAALTVQAAVVYLRSPLPDFVGWLTAARDQVRGASKMSRGFESGRQRLER